MSWPSYSMFLPKFSRTTKTTRLNCNSVVDGLAVMVTVIAMVNSLYIPKEEKHQPSISYYFMKVLSQKKVKFFYGYEF